jgi:hypothetical protein
VPRLEGLGSGGTVLGCRHVVALAQAQLAREAGQEEKFVDRVVGGQEPLSLSGRLEPLHLPFSSAGRLVRVLCPVIEPLVLAMLLSLTLAGAEAVQI